MNSKGRLQLAVAGVGDFGTRYVRALRGVSGVDVRWVMARDLGRTKAAAAALDVPRWTVDVAEVCADPEVDAVVVVTPEAAHRAIAVVALEAGKHVIVEKPLATTDEDAAAMVEAARASGKLMMTALLLRFDTRYAQLKDRLPEIGRPRSLYAWRNFDRNLFALYSRTHSFVENAIHDIDLILWYVGGRVARANGFCRNTMGLANPDVNWGVLEFEDGTVATLQTTWLYPPQTHRNLQWNAGIQVMGDRGVLEVANDAGGFRANTEGDGILLLDQTGWADIHGEPRGAFGAMLRHFVACIRGEAAYRGATPDEALEGMRVARMLVEDAGARDRRACGAGD